MLTVDKDSCLSKVKSRKPHAQSRNFSSQKLPRAKVKLSPCGTDIGRRSAVSAPDLGLASGVGVGVLGRQAGRRRPAGSNPRPRPQRSPRGGANATTRGGLGLAGAPGPVTSTHRGGGLPGGGHNGGHRGGHVVAAHPPAGGQRVGSGRELGLPAAEGRASRESQPAPPGARSGACAPPRRPALFRALDPELAPRLGRACASQ